MSAKFYPGPWAARRRDAQQWSVWVGNDEWTVADVWGDQTSLMPHVAANAHLIAAAPDLYAALRDLRAVTSRLVLAVVMGQPISPLEPAVNAAHDAATAALAKAEGRDE